MKLQFRRLNSEDVIKPFDCEDADLNGFLLETDKMVANARQHTSELLAVTYLIEDLDADRTIAYFSLLNDKIEREITDDREWKRLSREIPYIKRRRSHPAVKLGRLAVSKEYKGQKWGNRILLFIKRWFTNDNKTGCRYITVDALRSAQAFYEKNEFKVLVTPQENDETVLMYYDLKQFVHK
ncbi:GNAT family N-acetyltransferase [Alistipes putredinis]|jgi:GNAT superfamily N-acetyltransferase|uniref:GNAT family N-acetyltransferase n=1 Tax=Alistipes putredinis TaxID=28117 RepID=UPI003A8D30EC